MTVGQARILAIIVSLAYVPAYVFGIVSIWALFMAACAAQLHSLQLRSLLASPPQNTQRLRHFLFLSHIEVAAITGFALVSVSLALGLDLIQQPSVATQVDSLDSVLFSAVIDLIGAKLPYQRLDFARLSLAHAYCLAMIIPFAHQLFCANEIRQASLLLRYWASDLGSAPGEHHRYAGKAVFTKVIMIIFLAGWIAEIAFSTINVDPIACAAIELGLLYFAHFVTLGLFQSHSLLQTTYSS